MYEARQEGPLSRVGLKPRGTDCGNRSSPEDLVSNQRPSAHDLARNMDDAQFLSQYYRPLGDRVRCDVTYGLPALIYVLELRSQKTVHPTLRQRILEVAEQLNGILPIYVATHVDRDPSDWDLRRGQQDIRRMAGLHKCDKLLDQETRQCNATATLFYQSESRKDVSARCAKHEVVPYKQDQLGRLLTLTEEEYSREIAKSAGS